MSVQTRKHPSEEYTLVTKDGRAIKVTLTDVRDVDEWRQTLRAQGAYDIAEDIAGKRFVPTMRYRLVNAGAQLQTVIFDIMQKISDTFNPNKKNGEDEKKANEKIYVCNHRWKENLYTSSE